MRKIRTQINGEIYYVHGSEDEHSEDCEDGNSPQIELQFQLNPY